MKIWIDNSRDGKQVIESLKNLGISFQHILTASTLPIVDDNGYMIVGLGNIRRHYKI